MCCGAAAEMPDFSIPEAEAEHKGDPTDKDQVSPRTHLAQLELQAQTKKVLLPHSNNAAHVNNLLNCMLP